MYQVTFLPILASGIASVILGLIWYHPRLFGGIWMRHSAFSPEMVERAKKRALLLAFIAFLADMYIAWTMNTVGLAFGIYDWESAIVVLAFSLWLGFSMPILLCTMLLDQRSIKVFFIHAFYWLAAFCLMALILLAGGLWTAPTYDSGDSGVTGADSSTSAAADTNTGVPHRILSVMRENSTT